MAKEMRRIGGQPIISATGKERIQFVLYDTEVYIAGGVQQLRYFQNLAGKTVFETNLEQPGLLPVGNTFVIREVFVKPISVLPVISGFTIFRDSRPVLNFLIQNKSKFELPLDMIAGGNDLQILEPATTGIGSSTATNGMGYVNNTWRLKVPITLTGLQNFTANITFYTPSPIATDTKLRLAFKGILERPQR